MSTDLRLALVTAPSEGAARDLARTLVQERLAACANLVPGLISVFRWEGALQEEAEVLLILKTTADRFAALCDRVVELHPYDVPEVIELPSTGAHLPYLEWVRASVDPAGGD